MRIRRLTGSAVIVLAALVLGAVPVRAASVAFGAPSIDGSFETEIVATQPVTLDGAPDRVEVLVTMADSAAPLVTEVPAPTGAGKTTLRHTLGGPDTHILPNTPLSVRWRLTTDGVARVGPEARTVVRDERFDWQTLTGDVVRVHWYEGGRAFGERALRIGEEEVTETAALFGVTESEPVDFFIYAGQEAFYDALGPGTRENVGGQANAEIRTMFANIDSSSIDDAWVANVVPHELIHLVFDTAVKNPYHFPPRWLNEGLAVYLSVGYDVGDRAAIDAAADSGDLIPLDGLVAQFPTSGSGFSLAYAESVSAVDFLVREHGQDTLVSLVRSYADGRTDDEAFEAAIGMDTAAFNDAWLADIGAEEPVRYGPQPAPAGPRPAGWGAAPSVAPGSVATPPPSQAASESREEEAAIGLVVILVAVVAGIALLLWSRTRAPAP